MIKITILHILKNIKFIFLAVFDDKISKPVVPYRGKNVVNKFIEAILKEMKYCKKKKQSKDILIKILLCLQKMKEDFNQVIIAGYVINCLLQEIIKKRSGSCKY